MTCRLLCEDRTVTVESTPIPNSNGIVVREMNTSPPPGPLVWDSLGDDEAAAIPDAAEASLEQVSAMLRSLRHLYGRIHSYDDLHRGELVRLETQRERHLGPVVRRVAQLEKSLRDYGRRAYEDFGKTSIATPNGIIQIGRPLVPQIDKNDELVAQWAPVAPIVQPKPTVPMGELRVLLEGLEISGEVRRIVRRGPLVTAVTRGERWKHPFGPGEEGLWVHAVDGELDGELQLIDGVSWRPVGYEGFGRDVHVIPA